MKPAVIRALRWIERFTKTDMVFLTKNAIWPVIGQVVASGTALVLAIAFSRFISKETYGTYKFLISYPSLFGFLLLPGMATALQRSIARGFDGDFARAVRSKLRWCVLYIFVGFVIAGYYLIQGNTVFAVGIALVFIFSGFSDLYGLYGAIFSGRALIKDGTMRYILGQSFYFFSVLVIMYTTHNLLLIIVAAFVPWFLVNYFFYREVTHNELHNTNTDPDMLLYGKHLSFIAILSSFVANLDNLLVFHYLGAVDLAIYSYAQAIPEQIKGPLGSIDVLLFSKFAKRKESDVKNNMLHKFLVLGICFTGITVIYWFLAPYFYTILFPQYVDAIWYSRVFALSLVSLSFIPASIFLSAHGKIREQYYVSLATSVAQLVTMFVFIVHWGLIGLIVSRVIVRFFGGGLNTYFALRM
ncbi:MAG: oligosaccharide flippase family protein [Candidatus Paceibacterota bacterium]|jgi:O-antigen/teichoic acid export membrane protein